MDQVVDRFIEREHGLMKALSNRTPVVETYLQNLSADPQLGPIPSEDHYFLGRMDMGESVDRKDYLKEEDKGMETRLMGGFHKLYKVQYQPMGFSWMVYADRTDFDRTHYEFHYIRREFLGDVRCLVFDVTPKKTSGRGRFLGRVWVEDQDYNIVRLNGTYAPAPRNSYFFHMDSWRLNLIPGYWVPAYIYSEEGDFSAGVKNKLAFKAQTRIWGYDLKKGDKDDELTQIRVDSVKDETATTQDASPLQAEREWQQQAEDNVIERLTRAGLLAPEGDVDHILQTVVNNLEVTNNIDLPRPVRHPPRRPRRRRARAAGAPRSGACWSAGRARSFRHLRQEFSVARERSLDDVRGQGGRGRLLVPAGALQPVAHELLVEAVGSACRASSRCASQTREESGVRISSIRRSLPSMKPNSNFVSARIRPRVSRCSRGARENVERQLLELFGERRADQLGQLLARDVLVVALRRPSSRA